MRFVVLTGDLVASSDLSAEAIGGCIAALEAAAQNVATWQAGLVMGFSRRGGDGWQLALSAPALGLRTALYLRASLRRLDGHHDTRIALATGDGTLPPNGDTNAAHGPAFTASGRLLDTLDGAFRMSDASGGAAQAAALLADHLSQGWTQAKARAVFEMLPPDAGTRAEAAERLGISRQAVDQALHAAAFPALLKAMDAIEAQGATPDTIPQPDAP